MSNAEGKMKVTEVASRPLVQDLLSHEVSFVSGLTGLRCSLSHICASSPEMLDDADTKIGKMML